MGYRVIHRFKDLQDNLHQYQVGDEYPRKFLVVKKERIQELLSSNNKMLRPLIEEIKEAPEHIEQETYVEIKEDKPKAKRTRKKKSEQ